MRLSTRITVSALLVVAAGATILAIVENARIREAYINERRADLKNHLETEAVRLSQAVETLRQDLLFLAQTPPINGIMRTVANHGHDPQLGFSQQIWAERLQMLFTAFSRTHRDYVTIRYVGVENDGRELLRVENRAGSIEITPPNELQRLGGSDYFKATLALSKGQIYLSEFDFAQDWGVSELLRRPTLRASTPVFSPSGKLFGMVVISMGVPGLFSSAAKTLPVGTQAYIADMSGQYLLHPEPQRTLVPGTGSKEKVTAHLPLLKAMFDQRTPDYLPFQIVRNEAGDAWVAAKRIHFNPDDPSRFLLLYHAIPGSVIDGHIATIPLENIVAGFLVMLVVGQLALLMLRQAFSPLEEIAEAADRITAGNRDIELPTGSGGEIGSLTMALNTMLVELSQREKSLIESEARYRRLHESMMDAFVKVDMSGRLLEFNHAFQEMLGYSADELARMAYADLSPEKWREFEKRIAREHVVLHGHSPAYETEYLRKNGTAIPVEVRAFLLRNNNNEPEAIWAIVRDITERNLARLKVQHSQSLLKEAQQLGQLGSWELNLVSGELHWTDEVYRIFELDPAQFSPSYEAFLTVIHPDDRDRVQRAYEQSLKFRHPYDIVHRLRFADGRTKWVREHCNTEFDASGKPLRSVGAVQDITRHKQTEDAILVAGERFRALFESISDAIFISNMEGRFIRVNQSACARLGYSKGELLQKGPADIATPEYAALVPEQYRQLQKRGELLFESAHVRKDGTIVPIELSARIIDYDGACCVMAVARDISARKRAEEELQRFFNLIPDLACIASADGRFLKVNAAWQSILGYTEEELLSTPFLDFIHPDDRAATTGEIEQQLHGKMTTHFVNRYRCKDGDYIWLEWKTTPATQTKLIYATARDMTERRRTEDLLRKSSEEITDLYNNAPCGYHSLDKEGNIRMINDTELSWLGYARDELVGKKKWQDLVASPNLLAFKKAHLQFTQQGFIRDFEADIVRKDGTIFTGLINASAIYDSAGSYVASRSTVVDITERKRVKRQLQELSAHLQTVREEEKASIAREIHDDLGGTLTALKIEAYRLENDLSAANAALPLLKRVNAMSQLLDNAVGVTRRVITDLRPTILDDLGLLAAIEWQATQFQKHTGIKCRVNCVEDKRKLTKQHSIALFRIFQETLTNVVRHSGASRVDVEFHCDDEEVMLATSDNGHGLPNDHAVGPASFGLRGMRERVEQLGGRISFESPSKGGFAVVATLPLPVDSRKEEQA